MTSNYACDPFGENSLWANQDTWSRDFLRATIINYLEKPTSSNFTQPSKIGYLLCKLALETCLPNPENIKIMYQMISVFDENGAVEVLDQNKK